MRGLYGNVMCSEKGNLRVILGQLPFIGIRAVGSCLDLAHVRLRIRVSD